MLLLCPVVLTGSGIVPAKYSFDWSEKMPPGYRLVSFRAPDSALQSAYDSVDGDFPLWTYEVRGTIDQVEKELIKRLGAPWQIGVRGSKRFSPNLYLTYLSVRPPLVRILASGERHTPGWMAYWAVGHLPLLKLGLVKEPPGGPIIDRFGHFEFGVITRREPKMGQ